MNGSFHRTDFDKLPKAANLVEQGHILKDWFIFRDSRHFGPLSSQQIRGFLSKKLISVDHYLWRPGFETWTAIKEVEGFKSYGKQKIKSYSDEEFSYKANLSYIDRITKEAHDLDFEEGSKGLTRQEALQKMENEKWGFLAFFEGAKTYFGFGEAHLNYGRVLGSFIFTAVLGAMIYKAQFINYNNELQKLPEEVRKDFVAIASKAVTIKNPNFNLYGQVNEDGEPFFVGAVNLPLQSKIRLKITGVTGTLVGAYRFDQTKEITLENQVFKTGALREASGKFIPAGKYSVAAFCTDCIDKNKILYKKEHLLGVQNTDEYQKNLKAFAESSRDNIRLEIDELEDLTYTLFNQYKATSDRFMQIISGNKKLGWQNFSAQWLNRQNKLVDLFQQLKDDEFKQSLYYLGLYEGYAKVVKQIFELHMVQDSGVSSSSKDRQKLDVVKPLVEKIDTNLKSLKAKVELARINFNQTEGLPNL